MCISEIKADEQLSWMHNAHCYRALFVNYLYFE